MKAILDEHFGVSNFRNEISWQRTNAHHLGSKQWPAVHEVMLMYSAGDAWCWHETYVDFDERKARQNFPHEDERGRYGARDLTGGKAGGEEAYQPWRDRHPSAGRAWALPKIGRFPDWVRELLPTEAQWRKLTIHQKLDFLDGIKLIHWPKKSGGIPTLKYYLRDRPGNLVADLWTDITSIAPTARERLNYPTQKPERLLERIIRASSNEGDLVLDCFSGSGTTAAVAEKLNRRWIACDLGRFAIHTTRKRLLGIDNVRPFVVQNLGKYERQVWQKAEFGEEAAYLTRSYRKFILDLYHADMVEGYTWLHGKKGGRMVHVGSVDSPVADGDVRNIALEFRRAIGSGKDAPGVAGVDVLGWDFALDMNDTAQQMAAEAGVKVRFLRIPREVLEKKAVDQGDIRFFELAALDIDHTLHGREISIVLTDFMIPPDDVPADVAKAVRDWKDWIDYWAVDFNYRDDTFHNMRQYYRTPKNRELLGRIHHTYEEPGEYTILVKAIDILGNDTTKTLTVKVV